MSMTGFGRGEAANDDVAVVVELRTVNNRFVDVSLRLPREYLPLEGTVTRVLKEGVRRGRVEATVRRQPIRSRVTVTSDAALFAAYRVAVERLLPDAADHGAREAALAQAVLQPGVLAVSQEEVDPLTESDVLLAAVESALADLASMRGAEGEALRADLDRHLQLAGDEVAAIEALSADVAGRLRDRLEQRLRRLLGDRLEPWRLAQEAALLAEKADISEEIARLRSHVTQLRDALERDDQVGRRIDFLLQEMNREVNTIGSKAAEHPVSHRVVELKAILERMREQAANVE